MTIGFSLSRHAVHLLLTQFCHAFGLGTLQLVGNTIVSTVGSSLAASTALGLGDGLVGVGSVDVHCVVAVRVADS